MCSGHSLDSSGFDMFMFVMADVFGVFGRGG